MFDEFVGYLQVIDFIFTTGNLRLDTLHLGLVKAPVADTWPAAMLVCTLRSCSIRFAICLSQIGNRLCWAIFRIW